MAVTSIWYLRRAIAAVEENDYYACEQALRGFAQSEVERLSYKRMLLERGEQYHDEEAQERKTLLRELNEKLNEKGRQAITGLEQPTNSSTTAK